MPGDPKECRQHARRCAELASVATTPEAREQFLSLQMSWIRLAADLETGGMKKPLEAGGASRSFTHQKNRGFGGMTGGQLPKPGSTINPRKAEMFHTARLAKTLGIELELDKARGSDGCRAIRADAAESLVVLSAAHAD